MRLVGREGPKLVLEVDHAEVRSACRPIPPAGPRVSFQRRGAEGVGEPAAPDHHALVAVEGDTVRDLVVLVALVGSEPTEIDEVIVKGGTWGVGADR